MIIAENLPSGQNSQKPVAVRNVPSGQEIVALHDDAPSTLFVLSEQLRHVVEPVSLAKRPLGHDGQLELPPVDAKRPSGHCVHEVRPNSDEKEPGRHSKQKDAPVMLPARPGAHNTH